MIKRKGVCDVCTREFELNEGSFAVRITKEITDRHGIKWTATILNSIEDVPEDGFSHVCGKACLYRAMDEFFAKKTEHSRFKVIIDNTDDRAMHGHGGAMGK